MAEAATGFPAITSWPLSRKISLAVAALLSIAIFALIITQARVADYRMLYANLASNDASSVIDWLKDQKIPYRIEDGGRAIHIPADKVYEARLNLAGAGLPRGGGVGFEVFDKQSFGMTDFTQKINYQRALQGELSRTISSLAPVEGARVMLALPAKRLFKDQQKVATASVILKLAAGRRLSENQVQGILHLVAGSIEGLTAENINVIDSNGNVLSKKTAAGSNGLVSSGMLDFQQAIERRLEERAQSLLDQALGPNNSQARVTAELDFSQVEKLEEIYDPKGTVPRSEQISEEKSGGEGVGGIPGAESNLGGTSSVMMAAVPSSSSTTETINYEVSKVVNKVVSPVGTVKKLSVAVLVADRYVPPQEEGQEGTSVPRTEVELNTIRNMITSALGLNKTRGDRIEVVSMPFEDAFIGAEIIESAPASSLYQYLPYAKYGLLTLGTGLLYFLLIKPIIRSLTTPGLSSAAHQFQTVRELEGQPAPEELNANDPTLRLRRQILASETSPTQVIRSWLNKA